MNAQIQTFNFEDNHIQILLLSGQSYFFVKEVAKILERNNWQSFLPGGIVTYRSRLTQKGRLFLLALIQEVIERQNRRAN